MKFLAATVLGGLWASDFKATESKFEIPILYLWWFSRMLEAGNFNTMNEAATKYIQFTTKITGNEISVLYKRNG